MTPELKAAHTKNISLFCLLEDMLELKENKAMIHLKTDWWGPLLQDQNAPTSTYAHEVHSERLEQAA